MFKKEGEMQLGPVGVPQGHALGPPLFTFQANDNCASARNVSLQDLPLLEKHETCQISTDSRGNGTKTRSVFPKTLRWALFKWKVGQRGRLTSQIIVTVRDFVCDVPLAALFVLYLPFYFINTHLPCSQVFISMIVALNLMLMRLILKVSNGCWMFPGP